jgi:F0F1-type ATP synthase beta subunit
VRYEIEVARGVDAYLSNQFQKINDVAARQAATIQQYNFTDIETDKFGKRYYRIKIIYGDGSVRYSDVRLVEFDDAVLGIVYPNPSTGVFNVVFQLPVGQQVQGSIINVNGQLVRRYHTVATGFPQTLTMDLSSLSAAVYLLRLETNDTVKSFKLFRQ